MALDTSGFMRVFAMNERDTLTRELGVGHVESKTEHPGCVVPEPPAVHRGPRGSVGVHLAHPECDLPARSLLRQRLLLLRDAKHPGGVAARTGNFLADLPGIRQARQPDYQRLRCRHDWRRAVPHLEPRIQADLGWPCAPDCGRDRTGRAGADGAAVHPERTACWDGTLACRG